MARFVALVRWGMVYTAPSLFAMTCQMPREIRRAGGLV